MVKKHEEVKKSFFIKDFFRLRRNICCMEDNFIRFEFEGNINILLEEWYMRDKRQLRWNLIHCAEYNKS